MIKTLTRLAPDWATRMSNGRSARRVSLKRLESPKLIWSNEKAVKAAANSTANVSREFDVEKGLIETCAYLIDDAGKGKTHGWADRYGGSGIGSNGGSGRSVILNGYSVKGIGPTPLIGVDAQSSHSSGGAFLEEAIREAIFCEFLEKTTPHGASPILAIIDTGIDYEWVFGPGESKKERRVLIVRPFELRPAHFQRAYHYRPADFDEKRADIARVHHNFVICSDAISVGGLRVAFENCYVNWAEQLAFAAVHNVALGSSPSNVTLDGRILDFGAVSTLPQLANFYISPGTSVIDELDVLLRSLKEVAISATGFDPVAFCDFEQDVTEKVTVSYESRLIFEILTVIGSPETFEQLSKNNVARNSLLDGFYSYYQYATRLRQDLLASRYSISFQTGQGVEHLWSADRPAHLEALRTAISSYVSVQNGHPMCTHWPITREILREEITTYVGVPRSDIDVNSAIALFSARLGRDIS